MSTPALACSALTYLRDHEDEHLSRDRDLLVERCVDHLVATAYVSAETARTATMQALGELLSRSSKAAIDCTRTTSFTLFMTDDRGNPVVLLAADLTLLAEQAKLSPPHSAV